MSCIKHELANGEDPGNSWVLGEEGELFQLDFVGSLPTPSGYMCLLTPQTGATTVNSVIKVADWPSMKDSVDNSSRKAAGHPVGGPFELQTPPAHPSGDGSQLQVTLSGQVLFAGGVDVYKKRSKKDSLATGVTLHGSESL